MTIVSTCMGQRQTRPSPGCRLPRRPTDLVVPDRAERCGRTPCVPARRLGSPWRCRCVGPHVAPGPEALPGGGHCLASASRWGGSCRVRRLTLSSLRPRGNCPRGAPRRDDDRSDMSATGFRHQPEKGTPNTVDVLLALSGCTIPPMLNGRRRPSSRALWCA